MMRKGRLGLVVVVIAVALLIGGLLRARVVQMPGQPVRGVKLALSVASNMAPLSLGDFKNGFASVIDPALPAVVNISSSKLVRQQNIVPDLFNDPLFRQFFGNQFAPPPAKPEIEREYSLGSGVIVDPSGYVLTNNHVVAGATDVEVFTRDQRKFKAQVVGTDSKTDIAVLKIEATGLPVLKIGDSSALKVGDVVFAIGDPFAIGETATSGIVSATGRSLGGTIEHYEDFIQTDAPINPGNSGGALIDLHGDLVGINTAIISGGGGNQGVGFAIPINEARNVMQQIVETGKVTRGYLGVEVQAVDEDVAKAFGAPKAGGALIGDVSAGSPAAKAGLKRGDIIQEIDGKTVNGPADLSLQIAEMAPGTVAHLSVFRMGQTIQIPVTLGEMPEQTANGNGGAQGSGSGLQGMQVQTLTPGLAQQMGIPSSLTGVVVTSVDPSSAAAAAGIQMGDVIQEVNRKPVHNDQEFRQALAGIQNQPVLLLINRGGSTLYVVVQPQ